jgi:hypothetical protein
MLMAATLACNQIPVVKSLAIEAQIRSREVDPTYDPNPNGYFAAPPDAKPADYPGQAIKIPLWAWPSIPEIKGVTYRVLLTSRNIDEVRQSFAKAFGDPPGITTEMAWDAGEANLLARADCEIITVDFATMIADPVAEFIRVAEQWPVNPVAAAATIDAALYRNKGPIQIGGNPK